MTKSVLTGSTDSKRSGCSENFWVAGPRSSSTTWGKCSQRC
jgi:hypothetical protein